MCHVVHVASDADLPLVAASEPPVFSVSAQGPGEEAVRDRLAGLPQLRELGSSSGCGCDFHAEGGGASRLALLAYLAALPAQARVLLYSCWHGDWAEPARETIRLPLSALARADAFAEGRLIIVERS